jgi:AcrR family transcriptional regulator
MYRSRTLSAMASADVPAPRRLALPRAPRPRRSQAERTAATRARVLRAVVESIAEVGFERTTAAEIARRAGVTWGAVQHHFGGKDGILAAVLEESFAHLAGRLAAVPVEGAPLAERVRGFVAAAWRHFASPDYRSAFEILLHYRPDEAGREGPTLQAQLLAEMDALWSRLFADAPIPRRRKRVLQHYAMSVLSGLATTTTLEGRSGLVAPEELSLLEATLLRELAQGGAPGTH